MQRLTHRIAIVEDEEIARQALRLACESSGCPVEVVFEAASGRQIVEHVGNVQPDIILMDVVLPGVDGLAAARYVHQLYPSTRVVMISAYDRFDYAQEALRAGVIDYLLKPVRPEQLTLLLKKVCADLDAAHAQQQAALSNSAEIPEQEPSSPYYAAMKRAEAYIAENYARGLTLEQVAAHIDMAPTYFSRIFMQEHGYPFIKHLTHVRLEEAKRLLRTTTLPIADIGRAVGYHGLNYLAEVFKAEERTTPSAYRRKHTRP